MSPERRQVSIDRDRPAFVLRSCAASACGPSGSRASGAGGPVAPAAVARTARSQLPPRRDDLLGDLVDAVDLDGELELGDALHPLDLDPCELRVVAERLDLVRRRLEEAERRHLVRVLLVAQEVGLDELVGEALGLPRPAKLVVCPRFELA